MRITLEKRRSPLNIPFLNTFEKGIGSLKLIRLNLFFKGQKDIILLYTIDVKQGSPSNQRSLEKLKLLLDSLIVCSAWNGYNLILLFN